MQFSWEMSCFTHKYGMYSLRLIVRQVLFFFPFQWRYCLCHGGLPWKCPDIFSWKVFMMILINLICLFCLLRNRTVPDLPPKNYFGRFSKEVVDARQQGLQDFLIEWVIKEIKIHFTESIFVWTKGYCSFSRNSVCAIVVWYVFISLTC